MIVSRVLVRVKPEFVDQFIALSSDNARNSAKEPGIHRFEFFQMIDDPTQFMLVEVFRDVEATLKHKETAHYQRWAAAAPEMMAEPRSSIKYKRLVPSDEEWS